MSLKNMSSFIRVFSSDRKTSGTHYSPVFKNFKNFKLFEGDKIKFSWTMPIINNISSPSNSFLFDKTGGTTYASISVIEGRYSLITRLTDAIKTATVANAGRAFTISYNDIVDTITISSATNFSLNVVSRDLLNILGFSIGVKSGANTYTCEGHPDIFPDNIFVQSNLADYIEDGDYSVNRKASQYPDRVCDVIKYTTPISRTLVYDNNLEYTINRDFSNVSEVWFNLLDINSNPLIINNQMSCTMTVIGKK